MHWVKKYKSLYINGKVYPVARVARCCTDCCNTQDKTKHVVASVASPFRDATVQQCVCQRYKPRSLKDKLDTISCLDELYGFANRRKVTKLDLPKWTDEEKALILQRKLELENENDDDW